MAKGCSTSEIKGFLIQSQKLLQNKQKVHSFCVFSQRYLTHYYYYLYCNLFFKESRFIFIQNISSRASYFAAPFNQVIFKVMWLKADYIQMGISVFSNTIGQHKILLLSLPILEYQSVNPYMFPDHSHTKYSPWYSFFVLLSFSELQHVL